MTTNEFGVPGAQVVIYAIARGAYDNDLWGLQAAMKQRRRAMLNAGRVIMSKGDLLELSDQLPSKHQSLECAIVRVVRIPDDKAKITVRIEKTALPTFRLGKVYIIPRSWVLGPVSEE